MTLVSLAAFSSAAWAGFDSWTAEVENDPFSGGQRVTVGISTSMRSGVVIICDSAEKGLMVRAVPGFAFDSDLAGFEPEVEFAIDGERLLGQAGETGAVGDNLAASQVMLSPENAKRFVDAFAAAKKQIAIKDGISDRPHLMPARGTTKSGQALLTCMGKQAP
ncbi:hypothetical protein J5N58_06810 [Rhizobium cremeum]|uniref:hypothetical protein n=1 Tax=Rhizobium cremeum TaxID=2813827 RepID=UPI001FD35E7B|nr:hypothetical protein [Rhizobium cremeum]MCJ7996661.1 hypothetical protein [Rhizobium cremeum]MCJ7999385.1 hypothetical protein [Rhizobium cremeum]